MCYLKGTSSVPHATYTLTVYSIQTSGALPPETQSIISKYLTTQFSHGRNLSLDVEINPENSSAALEEVIGAIVKKSSAGGALASVELSKRPGGHQLPRTITFPYSRHSSYPELRDFVNAWKPKDVWPCTFDEEQWLGEGEFIGA